MRPLRSPRRNQYCESGASRRIFPMPPFSPSTCASAASHNFIRRPIGRTNLPSRTSSANSRTLDGSGRASTRVVLTAGFCATALSGKTAVYPKEPFCFTFAISFAATSPPTVSAIASTERKVPIASSSSIASTPRDTEGTGVIQLFPANTCNHLRAYLLRRMHGRAPNTAQGSCDQNNLSLLHICRKAHKLVSRECNERDRRRVRQVHAIRQMGHVRIVHCHQLGIGRVGECKNAVAGLEVLHMCADRVLA